MRLPLLLWPRGFAILMERPTWRKYLRIIARTYTERLATIAVSLLGFCLTVISIVVGFSSYERLAIVRRSKHFETLWKVFFHTIDSLALLSLVTFICLIFDRDQSPIVWLEIGFFFFSLLSVFRLARSIWALKKIVWLVARPSQQDVDSLSEES